MLTGSALHVQQKTFYHVGKMTELAGEAASLTTLAGEELESSIEMGEKAAVESEQGLELQSTSIELELDAEREFAKAAGELALGKEFSAEAEELHAQAAEKTSESEIATAKARDDFAASEALLTQAEEDRAAELIDEEKSAAAFEESSTAEELAIEAEERVAEYEAIVIKNEGQSLNDGESLAQTEVGALEDAEVVASCTPIPFLNFVCEAFGAISETAFTGRAAFVGAKAALESLSAASAQRKENAELAIALEKREEAARFAAKGREYQSMAEEEGAKASEEVAEADRLKVDMEESEFLVQSDKDEALKDEALAALDEDMAAEYVASAAQDEAIGTEEEASSIIAQTQAEELLGSSTGEELSANSMRLNAESKEAKAEQAMKNSMVHGSHAFGFAIESLMTAGIAIYVVAMRFLFHVAVPAIKRSFASESQFTALDFGERVLLLAMHFTVVMGTITLLAGRPGYDDDAITSRWKAPVLLASAAGLIEASTVHSLHEACCCYMNGNDVIVTSIATAVSIASNAVYLVPVVLMECLTVVVVFGPTVFDEIQSTLAGNQVLLWFALLLMFFIRVFKFKRNSVAKPDQTKHKSETESGVEEGYFCGDERKSLCALNTNELDQEYGSMEEISLLNGSMEEIALLNSSKSSEAVNTRSVSSRKSTGCYQRFCHYWESLQLSADLLVCALMAMLLYHSWPLLKVLEPVSKSFLGVAASLHGPMMLLVVTIILLLSVHLMFVR